MTDSETGYVAFSLRHDDDWGSGSAKDLIVGLLLHQGLVCMQKLEPPLSQEKERRLYLSALGIYIVRCMLIMTSLQSNLANSASLIWHALHSMPEPSNHANWAGKEPQSPEAAGQGRAGQVVVVVAGPD